ncbi:PREDICTED: protein NRT1/ PTR FAMILY 7.3-like isoform X1 [Ipomoea nil]|uniref:protein NRT1/ PTR FAMILY 7.3-like isoform X1 n=1 Tax=Ipomoea nil TaxID=35883 RepID=UPI00090134CB|nr:PREDICTED: protein NRT1/ PTR FAMILY 7.3-like isoform X1 [Ipomoea nil]
MDIEQTEAPPSMAAADQSAAASSTNFIESEDGKLRLLDSYTRDGSTDRHGKPALKRKTGGWKSGILLLVSEGLAALAFTGVEVNMVLFSKSVMRKSNADAANLFSRWMGTLYIFALFGAFLSDSYMGRYLTIIIFLAVMNFGLVALSLLTHMFMLEPEGCGRIGEVCNSQSRIEVAMYYVSIYLLAIGSGSIEPVLATLGADQFDEEDPEESKSKTKFFSYFYVALNLGSLVAETVLVYIENLGKWVLAFWISTSCGFVSLSLLIAGAYRYRHIRPFNNPVCRLCQVIVASLRKLKLQVPLHGEGLYEVHGRAEKCNRRISHTDGFEFLDRAAIVVSSDMTLLPDKTRVPNPWRLCTVTQVEEVKCVLRLLPIWVCTILSSIMFVQVLSLFVEQGAAMNTKIADFDMPPASMTSFDIISTSTFIICYENIILPVYVKLMKRKPKPPSELQRIGIGLVISIVAMVIAGLVEQHRQRYANRKQETSSLSIFWQTPQYVLVGVAEAFIYVAQWEFFASQIPDSLKSMGLGLSMSSSALGSYLCSIILSVVMKITTKNGNPGWVPPNLNDGHLDRFFFLSAAIVAVDLVLFIICAKRYKAIVLEKREEIDEEGTTPLS